MIYIDIAQFLCGYSQMRFILLYGGFTRLLVSASSNPAFYNFFEGTDNR